MEPTKVDTYNGPATVFRGGAGEPLVFLHAAGGIQPGDPMLAALEERYELVAPLAPGFNDLAEIDEIRDVHDLALYYDDLLDALGLDGVPVVGHSFGGMTAAELACHVPTRVSKLVLIAAVGLWNGDYPVADLFATPFVQLKDLLWGDANSPAAQMAAAAFQNLDERGDEVVEMLVPMVQGMTTAAKYMWPIPDKGLSRRLHRVKAPTLVIWGTDDKLTPPQYADDFAKLIPDARVEMVSGAGHMVTVEQPDQVVKLIDSFVSG